MEWYLSVGQTSRLFNITSETLRHYDRKGILKPIKDENNGYRYYTWKELERLDLILEGKYLEIPLNEIKEVLDENTAKSQLDLIKYQEKVIEDKIRHLEKLKRSAKEKKKILNEIISFENRYDFEKFETVENEQTIFYIPTDHVSNNKIKQKDPLLRKMFLEEWLQVFKVDTNKNVEEIENYFGIYEKSSQNIELTDENIKWTKQYKCKFIEVKFYGSLDEIEEYVKRLVNFFYKDKNKLDKEIDTTVKYIWNIYNKKESNYLVEISLPIL